MSIAQRISNGWRLLVTTLEVIRRQPKLLVFPALICVATLGLLAFFVVPVITQPTGYSLKSRDHWKAVGESVFTVESAPVPGTGRSTSGESTPAVSAEPSITLTRQGLAYLTFLYFASMFIATFFSVAFYHEILKALGGQAVSFLGGVRFALSRLPGILLWSLFAGLVGYFIKTLEERVGLIGKLVLKFVGVAWSVASVFAIPILVTEEVKSPLQVLRQSSATIRKTWGEALLGYTGLQLGWFIALLGSIVCLGGGMALGAVTQNPWVMVASVVVWLAGLFAVTYVMGVAGHVYRAALYLFATNGAAPEPFDTDAMALAWKFKKTS